MQRDESVAGQSDRLLPEGAVSGERQCAKCLAEFGRYPPLEPVYEWQIRLDDRKYTLSSWRLMNPKSDVDSQQVDVQQREVSKQFAALVYQIWANNILEARFTRHGSVEVGGISYRFRTNLRSVGAPSASTRNATANLPPKWLVAAGEEVMSFARASNAQEAPVLARLEALRKRLNDYYHPPREAGKILP